MPQATNPTKRQSSEPWSNPSVARYAKGEDPIAKITAHARNIVINAIDHGWSGPPFDPLLLAEHLGIEVQPKNDIPDARTLATPHGTPCIEYNPNRPHGRRRYSIAHEIAHTLFPDCLTTIRNRAHHRDLTADEWQLEALCNIAAAEFLMPIGTLTDITDKPLDIDTLLTLHRGYQVSTEALSIRLARITTQSCALFCASRHDEHQRYDIDYVIPSQSWNEPIPVRQPPADSIINECTAIGYTAKGTERWLSKTRPFHIECVGIPPYPGTGLPRVLGIIAGTNREATATPTITYLKGDATQPRGHGPKLIAHIVNDKTPNWGGAFAQAIKRRWPQAQDDFRAWTQQHPHALRLGNVHFTTGDKDTTIATMIAQKGYGPAPSPRIRYVALRECLTKVAQHATTAKATIHLPRIGTGQAGGRWDIIQELVEATLLAAQNPVVVYDPPNTVPKTPAQTRLNFQP
jgi:Zn-dependent peptidase ImmA (M78 family)/O-acetyl-ADP-ribose deacetylase (regulator of RNase III)